MLLTGSSKLISFLTIIRLQRIRGFKLQLYIWTRMWYLGTKWCRETMHFLIGNFSVNLWSWSLAHLLSSLLELSLFKLTQQGSIHDYNLQVTALACRTYGMHLEAILDCFVSDLKPDLRREEMAQNPISLMRAVSLANFFEDKYNYKQKSTYGNTKTFQYTSHYNTNKPNTNQITTNTSSPPLLPTLKPAPFQPWNSNIRRMLLVEM